MSQTLRYRADIDGLRAAAVLPVVLFHAGIPAFSGGFVGVDVFFVISGFLITGILAEEMREGRYSILNFYWRRVKRIFPALLLVTTAATIAALIIFPPDLLIGYAKSLASTAAFASNFYFWKNVDYFATNAHVQPLLHTWSLAVEEQFYIFYPLLLAVLLRFPKIVTAAVSAVLLGSFLLAVAATQYAPGAAFYLLPTRAWELMVGALLALGWPSPPRDARVASLSGVLGAALIAGPVVWYTSETPFPGLAAAPPTIGAALIIWSGLAEETPLVARLLAYGPAVAVGRASYSFYLWHYPLLSFAAYLAGGQISSGLGSMLAALALALSFGSLRLVEDPVRRSKRAATFFVPLVLMAVTLVVALGITRSEGLPDRLPQKWRVIVDAAQDKSRHPSRCMSAGFTIVPVARPCLLGTAGMTPHVLLWGDSHAMVTATSMESAARQAGASFLFVAAADCPPGIGFKISPAFDPQLSTAPAYRYCETYNREMLKRALAAPIDTIVISSRWSNWRIGQPANPAEKNADLRLEDADGVARSPRDNTRIFEKGFFALLRQLAHSGKRIVIVGPFPEPKYDVPYRLYLSRFGLADEAAAIGMADYRARHQLALSILSEADKLSGQISVVYPADLLCRGESCPIIEDGRPLFLDHNHLSLFGARKIAPLFEQVFHHPQAGRPR